MYGDDTWLKLFPNIFSRVDGTSSFFVSVSGTTVRVFCSVDLATEIQIARTLLKWTTT